MIEKGTCSCKPVTLLLAVCNGTNIIVTLRACVWRPFVGAQHVGAELLAVAGLRMILPTAPSFENKSFSATSLHAAAETHVDSCAF